ncbi:MAG: fibrobacter succinogenes major paralogous domain-containing protein [Paludibacter sp.]|nr:fibrobacter succinogenes major paralogous domain-containing protein [Paludibacter sp.]
MQKNSILLPFLVLLIIILTAGCSSKSDNTVRDEDGNVYHTIKIGNQTWLVENLKTTKLNDGTPIPVVTNNTAWAHLSTPGYCWYNNDETTYKKTVGALYNWHAVNTGKLAPIGWHVATLADWENLQKYLNTKLAKSGSMAKVLASVSNWTNDTIPGSIGCDLKRNNTSGFDALPGGYRGNYGGFHNFGLAGYWWPTDMDNQMTGVWYFSLFSSSTKHLCQFCTLKQRGFSVRCVKNPE